jgi:hypothetical protein
MRKASTHSKFKVTAKAPNLGLPDLKFGVLGTGRYGTKIRSKLERMGTVIWAVNSDADYNELEIPDWVFIATPNIFHYEQAEYFLGAGVNVFVEKPATLSPDALEYLINLSKLQDRLFYVDDVFLYRSDLKQCNLNEFGNQFGWHKSLSTGNGSLLDRFAYHHLYLIFEALGGKLDFKVDSYANFKPCELNFDARINNKIFNFHYSTSGDGKTNHTIFGEKISAAPNDALSDMLIAVLSETASFDKNHQRAIWALTRIIEIKKTLYKNVGIIGGGIFGSTIAIELANQGYNVTLFERHKNVLEEASSINQYRVHAGYHYPRSSQTALDCKMSLSSFEKTYKQSIVSKRVGIKHYYAIASQASVTSPEEYISFMDTIGLLYKKIKPIQGTDMMVEVEENIYDPAKLVSIVKTRLKGAGVELRLGKAAVEDDLKKFDFTIIATYANINDWCNDKRDYQYEICEKPVLKLPDDYRMKSIVIMDGPFMCIDPFGNSDLHVMGNVVHAIHHSNIGHEPIIPVGYESLLNRGVIRSPSITKIDKFVESARQFFPDIHQAKHIGSMYTIRAVLPDRDKDDARPTLVDWISEKRLMVFSGKICTCVNAAKSVLKCIEDRIMADDA